MGQMQNQCPVCQISPLCEMVDPIQHHWSHNLEEHLIGMIQLRRHPSGSGPPNA